MADKLLQNRSQSEKPTRGRGGQVAAPKLQALQFGERQQSDRGRVAGGRRQHGDDLQGAEEAQHASQFLQGAVVAKVRDVLSDPRPVDPDIKSEGAVVPRSESVHG